jgi:hypothetical protein
MIYFVFDTEGNLISSFFTESSLKSFFELNEKYDRYNTQIIVTTGYDNTDEFFDEICRY